MSAHDTFDELAAEHLARGGATLGKMMNSEGLRAGEKGPYYALVSRGRLVLKLPATQAAELVADGEARLIRRRETVEDLLRFDA